MRPADNIFRGRKTQPGRGSARAKRKSAGSLGVYSGKLQVPYDVFAAFPEHYVSGIKGVMTVTP
jgi:hypothetical protein